MDDDEMKKEYDFSKGQRGLIVPVPRGKTRITIRLDDDIIEAVGGGSYQGLINDVLREHMRRGQEPLEETLRRVLREELARAA